MRVLSSQGDLVDSYDPALKEPAPFVFLAFDGHCYMYRAVKRVLERQRRACSTGARRGDPAAHPRVEALRRRGRAAGAVLVRGPAGGAAPAHGRRREPQGGHQQPGAVLRAEAEAGHQDPRAAGGARGAVEVVRGAQPGVPGPAPGGLAHEIFLKLLKAKREVPGAAERQKTLAAQDGKRALCGCGLTGACELDHWCR